MDFVAGKSRSSCPTITLAHAHTGMHLPRETNLRLIDNFEDAIRTWQTRVTRTWHCDAGADSFTDTSGIRYSVLDGFADCQPCMQPWGLRLKDDDSFGFTERPGLGKLSWPGRPQ
jgi:hypothetical protein